VDDNGEWLLRCSRETICADFKHIGPDRTERQDLNVVPFHWRKIPRFRDKWKRFVFRIARIERGNGRMGAFVQDQRVRLRKALKGDPAQILDLSLVPTEEWNASRHRLQVARSLRQTAAQQGERLHGVHDPQDKELRRSPPLQETRHRPSAAAPPRRRDVRMPAEFRVALIPAQPCLSLATSHQLGRNSCKHLPKAARPPQAKHQ